MITVATHSGRFHADDVFAVAALQLHLGEENINVVRTRDESVLVAADYVVDVGGVYDPASHRYDHHQNGAPVRDNGIPYAGFGLIWKHFGELITGSEIITANIDATLVQPIDAGDNGVSLYSLNQPGVSPYEIYQLVSLFVPAWGSGGNKDEAFLRAVAWARTVIVQIIEKEKAGVELTELVEKAYQESDNHEVLEFAVSVPMPTLIKYEDVQMVVCPDDPTENNNWTATCVRKNFDSFESRVSFPKEWAGLRDKELQDVSGIPDAIFCHKARFFFVAGSKESVDRAVKLAK